MKAKGFMIAAPSSGSGKTLISLGLMAAFARRGIKVAAAKVGPDYIDPAFHRAALGRAGSNLDGWSLSSDLLAARVARVEAEAQLVVCEGVMGLFDGAQVAPDDANGSTAEIAAFTQWPVILVVDAARMAGSAAAIVAGFAQVDRRVTVAGVIFNWVSSERHRAMITQSMARFCPGVVILGFLPTQSGLSIPSRHLGLVQADEHADLRAFIDHAASQMEQHVALDTILDLAQPSCVMAKQATALRPLGQTIAVARDVAFAFAYEDLLLDWQHQGAEISFFSPLNDEAPNPSSDAVYLPGGYPELHAATLSHNQAFLAGVRRAAHGGALIYGECGGYMALGQALVDAEGQSHAMLGLLPVVTSIANPKRHLGYRMATLLKTMPFGAEGSVVRGHEFHYAQEVSNQGAALLRVSDASGDNLCNAGCFQGLVFGSFIHLIALYTKG